MTAAEYVALAKRAAEDVPTPWAFVGNTLYVTTLGNSYVVPDDGIPPSSVALKVRLTKENTFSEDALVRALLASALRVEPTRDGYVHAVLADEGYIGDDEATVRADLLDALLAPPSCIGSTGPRGDEDVSDTSQPAAAASGSADAGALRAEFIRRGYRPVHDEAVMLELSFPGYLTDCDYCMGVADVTYFHPGVASNAFVSACRYHYGQAVKTLRNREWAVGERANASSIVSENQTPSAPASPGGERP